VRETDREMKKKSEKGITPEQNTQLKVDGRALRQYAIHGFPMLIEWPFFVLVSVNMTHSKHVIVFSLVDDIKAKRDPYMHGQQYKRILPH